MASAPWRVDEDSDEEFKDVKLKVTSQPGSTPTMHVPRKKSVRSKDQNFDDSPTGIDPELRYSFQRNFQGAFLFPWGTDAHDDDVSSPYALAITQLVGDPKGIANAQKSLGIGQEEKVR